MNDTDIHHVHEYSFEEFRNLIQTSIEETIPDFEVYPRIFGGWTNLNLLASSRETSMVLKIPAEKRIFDTNPFEYAFTLASDLNKLNFSPRPIAIGRLPDKSETPFAIYEYIHGRKYDDISKLNSCELESLITLKTKLNLVKLEKMRIFRNTTEYVDYIISRHQSDWSQFEPKSELLEKTYNSLIQVKEDIEIIEDSEDWPIEFMHGDFHLRNIVFPNHEPVLLDFEEAALGNPLYDYAYLRMESYNPYMYDQILKRVIPDIQIVEYGKLCKVALYSVIVWTYNRLLLVEHNLVDAILSTTSRARMMRDYLNSKLKLLMK